MTDAPPLTEPSAAAPSGQPLLRVEDLRVTFDSPRGIVRAINGVSFTLEEGKTLAIVGESGSGKSVSARTIMNLLPSTATITGHIGFDDLDLRNVSKQRAKHLMGVDIAMVFQDPMTSLNPVKRIGAQLTESMKYHLGMSNKDATDRAVELLGKVGIPSPAQRIKQYPHELSGGMRQRVVIAIALACEPRLLIADEPTTALDVTVQKHILDLLGELQSEEGMSMILITHDLGVAAGRADDVAVMYAGRIVEKTSADQLFAESRHPYTDALLRSIPQVSQPSHTRLTPIPGRPPDLINLPDACSYAPRCRFAQAECLESVPEVQGVAGMHEFACFFPANTDRGREALATNVANGTTAAGLEIEGYMTGSSS